MIFSRIIPSPLVLISPYFPFPRQFIVQTGWHSSLSTCLSIRALYLSALMLSISIIYSHSGALVLSSSLPHGGDWHSVMLSSTFRTHLQDREFCPCLQHCLRISISDGDSYCPVCLTAPNNVWGIIRWAVVWTMTGLLIISLARINFGSHIFGHSIAILLLIYFSIF